MYTPAPPRVTRPTLQGHAAMVSSTHYAATAAALSVLERGGNAFDAAVAGGLVLHLVQPHLCGPGGDMVALVHGAGWDVPQVLCGQGPAPRGASIGHMRDDLGLTHVPGSGLLAAAVPGAMDAWLVMLRDYGTWELADVLAYPLGHALRGVPVDAAVAGAIAGVERWFSQAWPTSGAQWLPDGTVPPVGRRIRHPAWANVLTALAAAARGTGREAGIERARALWRTGWVAEAIEAFCAGAYPDSSGGVHAGVLCAADMADWQAGWEAAAVGQFRDSLVYKQQAWGQGPVLLEALAILDGCEDDLLDPATGQGAHTVLQALTLALADREAFLGPQGVETGVVAALLDPAYIAQRRAAMSQGALDGNECGQLPGRTPWWPAAAGPTQGTASGATHTDATAGEPSAAGPGGAVSGDTVHIAVGDRWGNLIAATPSGGWLQSSPLIPQLGFALGTRLQMTWLDEASPSALLPGMRPRTTLSPTIVVRQDGWRLACGTPGGDQQDQWQAVFLLRHLVGGYDLQQAIDGPMVHSIAAPASFWPRERTARGAVVEERMEPDAVASLRARGYRVQVAGPWALGRLCAVGRSRDAVLYGAADSRGTTGYAAGR